MIRSRLYNPPSAISLSLEASVCCIAPYTLLPPIQNHLAAVTAPHRGEALFKVPPCQSMGNHWRNVETGLQHHGHLVPGLIHFTSIYAFHCKHVEDHLTPVDRDFASRYSQHCDPGAMAHVREHLAKRPRITRHLQAYVETFLHA